MTNRSVAGSCQVQASPSASGFRSSQKTARSGLLRLNGRQPFMKAMPEPLNPTPPFAPTVAWVKLPPYQGKLQGSETSAVPSSFRPRGVPVPSSVTKSNAV